MKKWEYSYLDISKIEQAQFYAQLNELGQGGWELVAIFRGIAYFKRPTNQWTINQRDENALRKLEE